MSSTFFSAAKTEKQSGKFKGIDINTIYKGSSASPPKTAPTSRQHGLQVLGKVQSIRRMPPPANLPSLKSQSGGNDPNINIIPAGTSAGWSVTKEERKTASPLTTTTSTFAVQRSLQQQQAGNLSCHPHQMEIHPMHQNVLQGEGGILWSDVTSGGKRNYLDRKSFSLQDDFPELSAGGEEKNSGPSKKEDGNKDQQYGLGPSLRPQNVASWRDGGGKGIAQQPPQSPQSCSPSPQRQLSEDCHSASLPYHQVSPDGIRPGVMPPLVRMAPMPFISGAMPPMVSPLPGPPYSQRPPHLMMMPPPYAFRPGFHPPPYPPNFIPPRPAFMGHDYGMRPRMPQPSHPPSSPTASFSSGSAPDCKDKSPLLRSTVVKERDLEQFDKLDISEDSGWARSSVHVDYSEKLVFSDEEDAMDDKSKARSDEIGHLGFKWAPMERGWSEEERCRRGRQDDSIHSSSSTSFKADKQHSERNIGEQRPNSVGILPGDVSDIYAHPPYPGPHGRHPMMYDLQRLWPGPPMVYDRRAFTQPPHHGQALEMPGSEGDSNDNSELRMQHKPEAMSAVERARQRREEEERRLMEHQKNASMLKLKQLDEKLNAQKAMERERASLDDEVEDEAEERDSSKTFQGGLNKPNSLTSLSSDCARFVKSHSQQSMDCQSSDVIERPDSNPCPPSHKQPMPLNSGPYSAGISHRMPPPHPPFGYWGESYDPRWGALPFPHPGYGLDQTRFRMKGQLEHSGSLDDLHQGTLLPKHPLPAPPQPHNYYQYHPHNYLHADPYENLHYMGEYKDVHQRGNCQRDGEKQRGKQMESGPDDEVSSNADIGCYSGPKKILHSSSQQSSDQPQRKTILHRKKSESEKSDERSMTSGDFRERMCSAGSGTSSKVEEASFHEGETREAEENRAIRNTYHDCSQESQRVGRKFEDDARDEDDNYKPSHNKSDHWSQSPKKSIHKADRRENRTDARKNIGPKDGTSQSFDNNYHSNRDIAENKALECKEQSQLRQHNTRPEDGGLKKEMACRESVDINEADDLHKSKKNDFSRSTDSPNTHERKPKPKERPIYQHQWQRHACPPPISMDQAEQNQPNSSCYTSLKKQQSNVCDVSSSDNKQEVESNINQKGTDQLKSKHHDFDADKKSLSKESPKLDKKDNNEGAEEKKRCDVKIQKKLNELDYKEGKRQKHVDKDGFYDKDRDRYSYWRYDERDGKEYYSRKDHGAGKMNRPSKGSRNDGHKDRPCMNYKGSYEDNYQSKDVSGSCKEGNLQSKGKDLCNSKDRDDSHQGSGSKSNKRYQNSKNFVKSQDQKSEHNSEEANIDKLSKKEIERDLSLRNNGREEMHGDERNGEFSSRKDTCSLDEFGAKHGGRQRGGRGTKGREYSDIGDSTHGEERYRPQGSREFVRGGNKSFGGRGRGRDQQRVRGYIEEEDDEWEDERVVGGRGGGRFSMRASTGRRNNGRKPKSGLKDGQGFEDKPQKRGEGKKQFKDNQPAEDSKKELGCGSWNGPPSLEGIPSLMSKTISPPAMAKIAASLHLHGDREEKLTDSHAKQGKDAKSRNFVADIDQDKNREESRNAGSHYDSATARQTPTASNAVSSAPHRQSHYFRYHHQYHTGNNYDRRPRSSRGPPGTGHRINPGEKSAKTSTGSNSASLNNSGKDKKQPSEIHNEEWETASEGSEVISGSSNSRNDGMRPHPVKESNGEGGSSSNKKNSGGARSDKNMRRPGVQGSGFKTSTNKVTQGDEGASQSTLVLEVDAVSDSINKSQTSLPGKNKSINNGNKMVEGSSGDGNSGNFGGGECGDAGIVDDFPSTGGDGGGKDAQVYFLHEVQFDNQDIVTKFFARAKRKWIMKIIDPWSSSAS